MTSGIELYKKIQNPCIDTPQIIDTNDDNFDEQSKQRRETVRRILKHRKSVRDKLRFIAQELLKRADNHDSSKLQFPEVEWLMEMDAEPQYPYGSEEYNEKKERWSKFFTHHYANNSHHPEHYEGGINGMDLVDLCEFCIDIISYYDVLRVSQGERTLELQKERFHMSSQLRDVLSNTLNNYFASVGDLGSPYIDSERAKKEAASKETA